MSEQSSPLLSDQGRTTIADAVVSRIAGVAAQEVEGVRMGNEGTRLPGDSSPTVGEFFGSLTPGANTQMQTRGVSVEVGKEESAIDVSMAVEYGRPVQQVTEAMRDNVIDKVEELAGLIVRDVNLTVNDVFFPEHYWGCRGADGSPCSEHLSGRASASWQLAIAPDPERSFSAVRQECSKKWPAGRCDAVSLELRFARARRTE